MNALKGRRCYLGGPIEFCPEKINWRDEVKKNLVERFGLKVFDPFNDPKQALRQQIEYCKKHELYDELSALVHKFVRADLAVVDRVDFVISRLPHRVPTTGTHHEIISANDKKKPTLLVCPEGKNKIPDWYFGFIPHKFMFSSFDQVYDYLAEVNAGHHTENDRWWFVYNYPTLSWYND